jgi:hypothetical protein
MDNFDYLYALLYARAPRWERLTIFIQKHLSYSSENLLHSVIGLWTKRKVVSVIFTLTNSSNIPLSPVNLITEK